MLFVISKIDTRVNNSTVEYQKCSLKTSMFIRSSKIVHSIDRKECFKKRRNKTRGGFSIKIHTEIRQDIIYNLLLP